jgi:hypothetical protein
MEVLLANPFGSIFASLFHFEAFVNEIVRVPPEVDARGLVRVGDTHQSRYIIEDAYPEAKNTFYRFVFSLPRVCKATWLLRGLFYQKVVFDTLSIESYLERGPKDLFFPESIVYGSLDLKAIQSLVSKIPKVRRLRIEYLRWRKPFTLDMSVDELPNLERSELFGISGVVWDGVPMFERRSKKFEADGLEDDLPLREVAPVDPQINVLIRTPDYLDDLDPRTLYGRIGTRLINEGYANVVYPEHKNFLIGFVPTPQQCRFLLTFFDVHRVLMNVFKDQAVLSMTTPGEDGADPHIIFSCQSSVTGLEVLEVIYETFTDPTGTVYRTEISEEMMFEALEILKKEKAVFHGP